jgi:transposase-like protein
VQHPELGLTITPDEFTLTFPQGLGACAMLVNILGITDDAKCYEMVRHLRWPDGVRCPHCDSDTVVKQGRDETEPQRQRYECRSCGRRFDDLTDTIFAGHHRPLRVWVLVLYLMGLNLSNEQIAKELDLDPDDAQRMTTALREGVVIRRPEVTLSGEVECDEVYVVAGHKGHPEAVRKKGDPAGAGGGRGRRGGGRWRRRSRRSSG